MLTGLFRKAKAKKAVEDFTCGVWMSELGPRPISYVAGKDYVLDVHRSDGNDIDIVFDTERKKPTNVSAEFCIDFLNKVRRTDSNVQGVIFTKGGCIHLTYDGKWRRAVAPNYVQVDEMGVYTLEDMGAQHFENSLTF